MKMKGAKSMFEPNSVSTGLKDSQTENRVDPMSTSTVKRKKKQGESHYPFAFYAQMMRHDWYGKVHHRIRQRGWRG
ncbi:hypothetical protein D3C73_1585460 [compost metagenome]